MKNTIILFVTLLLCTPLFSQDIITLKTGEEILSKVTEITPIEIKYKKNDNLNGPTIIINRNDVFMIKYENGTKDVIGAVAKEAIKQSVPAALVDKDTLANAGMYDMGIQDAKVHFNSSNAFVGTLISSMMFFPIGLVTAVAISGTDPDRTNFETPDRQKLQNAEYLRGYIKGAKKKKVNAAWGGLGSGLIINTILIAAVVSSLHH